MSDQDRYEGLKKLPVEPALDCLAKKQAKLELPAETPPEIGFGDLLADLEGREDYQQAMKVLAHGLPPREAVWWGCLGARDELGLDQEAEAPPALAAAEAWVMKPTEETRQAAFDLIETEKLPKTARLCAMVAVYAEGTMGPGVMADVDTPPNAIGDMVFGVMMKATYRDPKQAIPSARHLLDRGMDIAKGGNGQVAPTKTPEPVEENN